MDYWKIVSSKRVDLATEREDPSLYVFYALGNTSVLSLFGSRMFLNLKEAGESKGKRGTSRSGNIIATVSALQFADLQPHSRTYIGLVPIPYSTDFY